MQADFSVPIRPILLATNGLRESDAAVAVARDLSWATGRPVSVVSVLEPPPLVAGQYGFVVPMHEAWEDRREALLDRVRKQIKDVIGQAYWPIETPTGNPASVIAGTAQRSGAALIVMGLGHHTLFDRALGSETALQTLRAARTPILAVPDDYTGLPQRAVVGVDFSDASVAAASQALLLLPSLTRMIMVQVAPRWDLQPAAYTKWRAEYECAVAPALDWVVSELAAPESVTLTTEIREGKTTKALLTAAEAYTADVVIVGSKGLGLLDRMLVGSTASGVIRSAQTAVFALPIAALADISARSEVPEMFAVGA